MPCIPRLGLASNFAALALVTSLSAAPIPPIQLKDFLGLCGHTVAVHPDRHEGVVSVVRDYHPASWDLGDDTSTPSPLPFAKNRVNWDQVYGGWKKAGMRIQASLMIDSIPPSKWKNLEADARAYGKDWLDTVEIGNEPGNYSDADYARAFDTMALDDTAPVVLQAASAGPGRWSLPIGPRPVFVPVR